MKFKEDIEKELFVTYGSYCTCGNKDINYGYWCKVCGKPLIQEALEADRWDKRNLLKVIRAVIEDEIEDYDTGYNLNLKINKIINDTVSRCDATKYIKRLVDGEKVI